MGRDEAGRLSRGQVPKDLPTTQSNLSWCQGAALGGFWAEKWLDQIYVLKRFFLLQSETLTRGRQSWRQDVCLAITCQSWCTWESPGGGLKDKYREVGPRYRFFFLPAPQSFSYTASVENHCSRGTRRCPAGPEKRGPWTKAGETGKERDEGPVPCGLCPVCAVFSDSHSFQPIWLLSLNPLHRGF